MEAITDPDISTGWYDAAGYENGDECAYVYGTPQGTAGQYYNQVINHDHYLTQEEFSNTDFFNTGLGEPPKRITRPALCKSDEMGPRERGPFSLLGRVEDLWRALHRLYRSGRVGPAYRAGVLRSLTQRRTMNMMKTKTMIVAVVIGAALAAIGAASAAGVTSSLFGRRCCPARRCELDVRPHRREHGERFQRIKFTVPAGTTFAQLLTLSTEFDPTVGGPRRRRSAFLDPARERQERVRLSRPFAELHRLHR